MTKKISLLFCILLFLNNCGYQPIYSKKSQNFKITSIKTFGETKVNKILSNKLKVYKDNINAKYAYDISINSKSNKFTISKDKKGNPTQFSLSISITLKIIDTMNNEIEKNFSEIITYYNSTNKFDLRKYENNLIKNMSENMFSDIILFIQTKN